MPWLETDPMNERKRFILEATGGLFSHTELCLRHGVSRKTGYKWLERYESEDPTASWTALIRSARIHTPRSLTWSMPPWNSADSDGAGAPTRSALGC